MYGISDKERGIEVVCLISLKKKPINIKNKIWRNKNAIYLSIYNNKITIAYIYI